MENCETCVHFRQRREDDSDLVVGRCISPRCDEYRTMVGTSACDYHEPLACYAESASEPPAAPDPVERPPLLDPGKLQTYEATGAQRSSFEEPPWHLLPFQAIEAVASAYAEGAAKYGPRNCEKGIPLKCLLNHAMRHIGKLIYGQTTGAKQFAGEELEDEDHLAHAAWNILVALETRERVKQGLLPAELMDL